MKHLLVILLSLVSVGFYGQTAKLTGAVYDSTNYGIIQGAKLHFIKNDTTIYSNRNGNYQIILRKFLNDTIVVTHHYALGTIKIPFKLKANDSKWFDIHFLKSCKSIIKSDICPKCKTNIDVIKIFYGMPSEEVYELEKKGKVYLNGQEDAMNICSPLYYCKKDSLEF